MKIKTLKIQNFRGYKNQVNIDFSDFTAIVGRNDIGKSTIMEALDIFFHDGKGLIKLDKGDINNTEKDNLDVVISVSFIDLPQNVIIDDTCQTTLKDEFLLNTHGELEIIKRFKNASTSATNLKISIKAKHPTNPECSDLLLKKQSDLKKKVDDLDLQCEDKRVNSIMRSSIWEHYKSDLRLNDIEIDVNSKEGDIRALWNKLQTYIPYYSLFQSDRKNTDSDDEVQDPLKEAVKQIIRDPDLQDKLDYVATKVKEKLQEVSDLTLAKIKEMNETIAESLHPQIPKTEDLKWSDVFKGLSIAGDGDIPINKRGSGVKRLILLNFFRAEAERRQRIENCPNIIYAIEEPETSQHKNHQRLLLDSLLKISQDNKSQIIITTHSSFLVKQLKFEQIKMVTESQGNKTVVDIKKNSLPYPSLNEVNYLAFGEVSEEYHNELYGYLQFKAIEEDANNEKEKYFEAWLVSKGCIQSHQWIRLKGGIPQQPQPCTINTYIRNYIHHPENSNNSKYSEVDLLNSIKKMRQIINHLTNRPI